jgi:hypothetical protein
MGLKAAFCRWENLNLTVFVVLARISQTRVVLDRRAARLAVDFGYPERVCGRI